MRALFYVAGEEWNSSARVFLAAARGLAARDHQILIVCGSGTRVVEHVAGSGVDNVLIDPDAHVASATWELHRVLQERFIEVAFVHTDREQLIVSAAMRLAGRGAVIRRVPAFTRAPGDANPFALRVAAAGLLFSSERERGAAATLAAWRIPAAVAPLGVDQTTYDRRPTESRAGLAISPGAMLIACPYDRSGRSRLATVMRALALLAPRHPEIHALVVGPGSLDEELRLHTSALNVGPLMTFVGDANEPIGILRTADIVWVTADGDAGAFGFLDAMALRLPVVAERSPLAEHYILGEGSGALLAAGDPPAVAAAIAALIADLDRRRALGSMGRSRVEHELTSTAMIDGFEHAAAGATDRTRWIRH